MLKKLFGKNKDKSNTETAPPQKAAFLKAIEDRKKTDPLVGIKIGSKQVVEQLMAALKNDKGVHVESLLAVLGSLAGYACHAAVREELVDSGKHNENEVFTVIRDNAGRKYYFGDLPNNPLAEGQVSIWSLVGGAAQHLGVTTLPDLTPIFSHVPKTVGEESFGVPRIADPHKPGDVPLDYVKLFWPNLLPMLDEFCDRPMERPVLLGLAAQQVIEMGKDIVPPEIAAELVMECAIPMSKIGPEWLKK